ncbi:MAG: cytochrome o ubiquinol oxidase subunit III [Chlamydiales bacterium]|nr:cytochrome o ubiquinol oxidase subunit III [Chlamydiia bacterium]MCP5507897.1 cytochrome o ubiquinol oxidase subunit III [Chlamydiales bacterium]
MTDTFTVYHTAEEHPDRTVPDPHQDAFSMTFFGFWVYLMTDSIIFSVLFLVHALLQNNTFGGPSGKDLFDLSTTLAETSFLLLSSFTCGLALLAAVKGKVKQIAIWLGATFLCGAGFLALELHEFAGLIDAGHSWEQSAFLSSFFTLVGTHGFHVTVGLTWLTVMLGQLYFQGLNVDTFRRLVIFNVFWHFLDLIWVFLFTFVYLLGVV